MTETFWYLISARWFQLMVIGFTVLTIVTLAGQWRRWRIQSAEKRLRDDLQEIYALELKAIRQQSWDNTEVYELADNSQLRDQAFDNAIAS